MLEAEKLSLVATLRRRYAEAAAPLKKRGKTYYVQGMKTVGVTTVLSTIDKSRPLLSWAVKLQVEADVLAAFTAYQREGFREGLSFEEFKLAFERYAEETKAHVKALREAADLGTDLHTLIDHRCAEMLGAPAADHPPVREAALWLFSKWEEWAERAKFEPLMTEFPVFSRSRGYAGTGDNLAFAHGELCLLDWKTSGAIYGEHHLQNVAYREALREMGVTEGLDVRGLLVRIPKAEDDPAPFEQEWVPDWTPEGGANPVAWSKLSTAWDALLTFYPWKREDDEEGLAKWRKRKAAERERETA